MIACPSAKINLGLYITNKKSDGYHDIETIFYPLSDPHDVLEVVPSTQKASSIEITGIEIAGERSHNLCMRAYKLLAADFQLPTVHIKLHKNIPLGAGLGGGSADAAETLKLLNTLFSLQLSNETLRKYALQLGSDVPFFIEKKTVFAQSRGEQMQAVTLDLSAYQIRLVHPQIFVSTTEAYSQVIPKKADFDLRNLPNTPIKEWKYLIHNDFENYVFKKYPQIQKIKEEMYKQGAIYASMSGSGSSIYGIWDKL
jgi:4-diphosphocytidyl-2-C-methyl-D-erythritol kinase